MDLGALIVGGVILLGRRLGTHLVLALVPVLVTAIAAALLLLFGSWWSFLPDTGLPTEPAAWAAVVASTAAIVVIHTVVGLWCAGLTMAVAEGSLLGDERTLKQSFHRTRGLLTRLGPLQVVIALSWVMVLALLAAVWVFPVVARLSGTTNGGSAGDAGGALVAGTGALFLCAVLMVPGLLVWYSRYALVIPVAVLEPGHRGWRVYRRSSRMTSDHRHRILGYVFICGLVVLVVGLLTSPLIYRLVGPTTDALAAGGGVLTAEVMGLSMANWWALLAAQVLIGGITAVVSTLRQLVTLVLYVDMVRRNRGEVAPPRVPAP